MATLIDQCGSLGKLATDVYLYRLSPDPATAVVDADADEECQCRQWLVRSAGYRERGDAYCWVPIPECVGCYKRGSAPAVWGSYWFCRLHNYATSIISNNNIVDKLGQ